MIGLLLAAQELAYRGVVLNRPSVVAHLANVGMALCVRACAGRPCLRSRHLYVWSARPLA
jgi:hypothetical protein